MAKGQWWPVLQHIRHLAGASSADPTTDGQLLARFAQDRDQDAFALLVERHGPLVWSACRRILRNEQDAEDVFQATFLVLARKGAAIRKIDSMGSWLYSTAYRLALRVRTASMNRKAFTPPADTPPGNQEIATSEAAIVSPEPTHGLEQQELHFALEAELNRLPEKYRAPLVLCYLQGKTNEQAARELRWTKGTVSGRLARARDLLRDRLARRGMALAVPALAALLTDQLATAAPSSTLTKTTTEAAILFAASQSAAAGLVSARVAALAEGVLRTMGMTKFKLAACFVLAVALVGGGIGIIGQWPTAQGVPVPEEPKLKTKPKERSRTEPPGVPLEATFTVKKHTYTLDLGGRTREEFDKAVMEGVNFPEQPVVESVFAIRNTSDKDLTIEIVPQAAPAFELKGPDVLGGSTLGPFPPWPEKVKLPAGKTWSVPASNLRSDWYGTHHYWAKPGDYTVTATYRLRVSPAPVGTKAEGDGFARVSVICPPVKLKVVAPR